MIKSVTPEQLRANAARISLNALSPSACTLLNAAADRIEELEARIEALIDERDLVARDG